MTSTDFPSHVDKGRNGPSCLAIELPCMNRTRTAQIMMRSLWVHDSSDSDLRDLSGCRTRVMAARALSVTEASPDRGLRTPPLNASLVLPEETAREDGGGCGRDSDPYSWAAPSEDTSHSGLDSAETRALIERSLTASAATSRTAADPSLPASGARLERRPWIAGAE
jgi:hypothetical protein